MAPTIQKFLRLKGGVGLLTVLNERGKTYSEIESEVEITSDTISKRKDEALEIGLIDMKPARRNNRTVTEYHLTDLGEELVREMALKGVVSNYLSMRTHQRQVEEKTEEVIDWVNQYPSQLMEFVEAREETLIDRSEDDETDGASDNGSNGEESDTGSNDSENSEGSVGVDRAKTDEVEAADEDEDEEDDGVVDGESRDEDQDALDKPQDEDRGRDLSYEEPEYPSEFMVDETKGDDEEVPEELEPQETWGETQDGSDDDESSEGDEESDQ